MTSADALRPFERFAPDINLSSPRQAHLQEFHTRYRGIWLIRNSHPPPRATIGP